MVHAVNSGHPGGSLGCVEFFVTLYNKIINSSFIQIKNFTDEFRLDPTYSSVKKFFPNAKITLYTDTPKFGMNYKDVF